MVSESQIVLIELVVWFIGAIILTFVVHPWRLSVRIKKDGLTKAAITRAVVAVVKTEVVDPMITQFKDDLEVQRGYIEENISEITEDISKRIDSIPVPSLPESIPSMEEIRTLVKGAATINADHLEEVRKGMPLMIIQTLQSSEAEALFKSYEGRMYRMKGIDIEDHQKGIEAAQEVYMEKIENDDPTDHTEIKMILKDALKIAAEGGLIDPENIDQKIGMVEGILRIAKRLKQYQGGRPAGKGSAGLKAAR